MKKVILCASLFVCYVAGMQIPYHDTSVRDKDLVPILQAMDVAEQLYASAEKKAENDKRYRAIEVFYEDLRNQLITQKFLEHSETDIAKIVSLLDIWSILAADELYRKVTKSEYKWLCERQHQYTIMRNITLITNSKNQDAIKQLNRLRLVEEYKKDYFNKLRKSGLCSKIK